MKWLLNFYIYLHFVCFVFEYIMSRLSKSYVMMTIIFENIPKIKIFNEVNFFNKWSKQVLKDRKLIDFYYCYLFTNWLNVVSLEISCINENPLKFLNLISIFPIINYICKSSRYIDIRFKFEIIFRGRL